MSEREYVRDKRSPKPKSETVSKVMSANKAKNTLPELALRKELWKHNLRGYRINYKKVPGRPDIAFVSKKVAVFINGCYWHRCPTCNYPLPKNNTDFWKNKFDKNIARDKSKEEQLISLGWTVIVAWECDIKKNIQLIVENIKNAIT